MSVKKSCKAAQACDGCQRAAGCSDDERKAHEEERLGRRLFRIRHRIMVMSGKGGVGKSTVTTNLAASLASEGFRVGILDADIHGPNIPKMLGLDLSQLRGGEEGLRPAEPFPNLKVVSMALLSGDPDSPIVWRGPVKHNLIKKFVGDVVWGDLDVLLVDLPPGTGDEPLSVANILGKVDGSVVVTTPQEVALLDSRKAVTFSRMLKIPVLGIVENMSGLVCPHCSREIDLFKVGGGERAARELGVPFLGRIPIDADMVEMCDSGKPIVLHRPYCRARKAFLETTRGLLEGLGHVRGT
jgi:Mrp family chromosome partitioning ATPase